MSPDQVLDTTAQAARLLRSVCAGLHVDAVPVGDVARLHGLLVAVERLAAGAQTRLARRLHDAPEVAGKPVEWIARRAGTSLGRARRQVGVSEDLPQLAGLDAALGAGAVSAAQTDAIIDGLRADPDRHGDLVDQAASGRSDLLDLRRRSRQRVADADGDRDATRRRHHRQRAFRTWNAADGEFCARINAPADTGAALLAAIRHETDQVFRHACRAGRRESADAYALDGLIATLTGRRPPHPDDPTGPADSDARPSPAAGREAGRPGTNGTGRSQASGESGDDSTGPAASRSPGESGTRGAGRPNPSGESRADSTGPSASRRRTESGNDSAGERDGDRADSDRADGDRADGDRADGDRADGDRAGPAAADTSGKRPRSQAGRGRECKVIGIVDVAALARGRLQPGDRCDLAGVGPVSLSAITDLLGHATTALLLRRGTVDLAVAHLGRHPTAFQTTAVEARDYVCAVDGCGATRNLEIDHTRDWTHTHTTRTTDLDWLCPTHHKQKTDGLIRLTGPPGHRTPTPGPRARDPATSR